MQARVRHFRSPVFENNPMAYHGYDINNYLSVDPHFGTKQDLIDLVDAAHHRDPPMRIILDVVVNHSGDNWFYPGNVPYYYYDDQRFALGGWRRTDRPVPSELASLEFYHRRGSITGDGWDSPPEMQLGWRRVPMSCARLPAPADFSADRGK